MNTEKQFRYFDLIMAVFVTVLVVSNVASSAKIVSLGFTIPNVPFLGDVPMAFDGGTILFPLSYIFGDILTEVYGYKRSRRVIWAGFFCLALSAATFWLLQNLPGDAGWLASVGNKAYTDVLGGMASGGIVLGSLAGFWSGEFSNSFVLAKLKVLTEGRYLWVRTIGSTIVGELVDTLAFVTVACLFKVFPWDWFISLTVTNYLFKCTVEAIFTPVTYLVVRFLKRAEGEDYYDKNTNFNPFKI